MSTAFAAVLMASPGLALAQAGGTNQAAQNAKNAAGGVAYSHIGQGGHTGDAMPIKGNNGNGNGNGSGSSTATRPSQRNPLLSDNGDVEITQMVGSAVFNEHDQNLGTVNGVLVGNNGVWAVISTHNKKVAVPFKDFVFGNDEPHYQEQQRLTRITVRSGRRPCEQIGSSTAGRLDRPGGPRLPRA